MSPSVLFLLFDSFLQAIEQDLPEVGKSADSSTKSMIPPTSSLPSNTGTFSSGAAGQGMAHPGPQFFIPEGNSSHAGNHTFNGNVLPKQTDQSQTTVWLSAKLILTLFIAMLDIPWFVSM